MGVKGFNVNILGGFLQGFGFTFGLFLTIRGMSVFRQKLIQVYFCETGTNQSLRDCTSICNDLIQSRNGGFASLETVESAASAELPAIVRFVSGFLLRCKHIPDLHKQRNLVFT